MTDIVQLEAQLKQRFSQEVTAYHRNAGELTLDVSSDSILSVCQVLANESPFLFQQLIDITAVDYQAFGKDEWETDSATSSGFGRGVEQLDVSSDWIPNRFAVVYHLLSVTENHRLRLKVPLSNDNLLLHSVISVWSSADWYEREVFDLFGLLFEGHPDLRRILTDYGFIGHPLRKDFPTSGHVEVRYDPIKRRVIYQPVTVTPRVLVPKVIRRDHRYADSLSKQEK